MSNPDEVGSRIEAEVAKQLSELGLGTHPISMKNCSTKDLSQRYQVYMSAYSKFKKTIPSSYQVILSQIEKAYRLRVRQLEEEAACAAPYRREREAAEIHAEKVILALREADQEVLAAVKLKNRKHGEAYVALREEIEGINDEILTHKHYIANVNFRRSRLVKNLMLINGKINHITTMPKIELVIEEFQVKMNEMESELHALMCKHESSYDVHQHNEVLRKVDTKTSLAEASMDEIKQRIDRTEAKLLIGGVQKWTVPKMIGLNLATQREDSTKVKESPLPSHRKSSNVSHRKSSNVSHRKSSNVSHRKSSNVSHRKSSNAIKSRFPAININEGDTSDDISDDDMGLEYLLAFPGGIRHLSPEERCVLQGVFRQAVSRISNRSFDPNEQSPDHA